MNSEETLAKVAKEVLVCVKCPLHLSRKNAVPGEGPATAEIMLIGEGPGFYEDQQGRPFVGASGKFLTELLAGAGLQRDEVWITNVVKCRPPANRDPMPVEVDTCDQYLERQLNAIKPSIIITLGRFSMGKFFPGAKIGQVHGQMRKVGERFVIPMFHPAAALHQASLKPAILADFAKLPALLEQARKGLGRASPEATKPDEPPEDDAQQLNLF
jgi:DNA polymerase